MLKPKILFVDWKKCGQSLKPIHDQTFVCDWQYIGNTIIQDNCGHNNERAISIVSLCACHSYPRETKPGMRKIHIRYFSVSIVSAKYFSTPDAIWSPYFRFSFPLFVFSLISFFFHWFSFHFKVFAVTSFSDLCFLATCSSSSSMSQTSSFQPSLPSLYSVLSLLFSFFFFFLKCTLINVVLFKRTPFSLFFSDVNLLLSFSSVHSFPLIHFRFLCSFLSIFRHLFRLPFLNEWK